MLRRNCELISWNQSLAGKILLAKDLRSLPFLRLYRLRLDDNELVANRAQGQMSQRGLWISGRASQVTYRVAGSLPCVRQ
jgi:hypothetical protein